nr:glycoside hydrolase family 3 C-terminal domain-containing protein [Pseudovibrio flavus]
MLSASRGPPVFQAGALPDRNIPGLRYIAGPKGITAKGATTFPVPIARAATFDSDLEERIGAVMGYEARACGATFVSSVCLNLLYHPRWGMAQESYGEDPIVTGEMGSALARGIQKHAMACGRYFTVGIRERAKFTGDTIIGRRALHEIHLLPFRMAVEDNIAAVMCGYNRVNGTLSSQNSMLLEHILREHWGYQGMVVTPFLFAIEDAHEAIAAGVDVELPFQGMMHSVLQGMNDPHSQERSASRALLPQLKHLGRGQYSRKELGNSAARKLAQEAAEKSLVLLKNEGDALPLDDISSLAVIGVMAGEPNLGDSGSSATFPERTISALKAMKRNFSHQLNIMHTRGTDLADASKIAGLADAAVVFVGLAKGEEGEHVPHNLYELVETRIPSPETTEDARTAQAFQKLYSDKRKPTKLDGGDRDHLRLSLHDRRLIEAVCAVNARCIVVVVGGGPIVTGDWQDLPQAIILNWYSGQEGGIALTRLLQGLVNPSGRLPFALARREEDYPEYPQNTPRDFIELWHGYRRMDREGIIPAFPFGFGLSFTQYRYSELSIRHNGEPETPVLLADLMVENTGLMDGESVVQAYVHTPHSGIERPPRELKAFQRVAVKAGEKQKVTLTIPLSRLAYYCEQSDRLLLEPATYELFVGQHSHDPDGLMVPFTLSDAG